MFKVSLCIAESDTADVDKLEKEVEELETDMNTILSQMQVSCDIH